DAYENNAGCSEDCEAPDPPVCPNTFCEDGETTTCPQDCGPSPCCAESEDPGCPSDPGLEACVCSQDEACCQVDDNWNFECIQVATVWCGLVCTDVCGDNECGNSESQCGLCPEDCGGPCEGCCDAGVCEGGDSNTFCGAGGDSCDSCVEGTETCKEGACEACSPQCAAEYCGSDTCGGTCPCEEGQVCQSNQCVEAECTPGEWVCQSTSGYLECSAAGHLESTTYDCASEFGTQSVCFGGACVSCGGQMPADYECNPYCPTDGVACLGGSQCKVFNNGDVDCHPAPTASTPGSVCSDQDDCGVGQVCEFSDGLAEGLCRQLCLTDDDCQEVSDAPKCGGVGGTVQVEGILDDFRICAPEGECQPTCSTVDVETCGDNDGCGGICTGCWPEDVCVPGDAPDCAPATQCQLYCIDIEGQCTGELTPDWGDEGCLDMCDSWPVGDSETQGFDYQHSLACRQAKLDALMDKGEAPFSGDCALAGPESAECVTMDLTWSNPTTVGDCDGVFHNASEDCLENGDCVPSDCVVLLSASSSLEDLCSDPDAVVEPQIELEVHTAATWKLTLEELGPEVYLSDNPGGPWHTYEGLGGDLESQALTLRFPHLPGVLLQMKATLQVLTSDGEYLEAGVRRFDVRSDFCPPRLSFVTPMADGVTLPDVQNITVAFSGMDQSQGMTLISSCEPTLEDWLTPLTSVAQTETQTAEFSPFSRPPDAECIYTLSAVDEVGNSTSVQRTVHFPDASCPPDPCQSSQFCSAQQPCGWRCEPCAVDCAEWFVRYPDAPGPVFKIPSPIQPDGNQGIRCIMGPGGSADFDGSLGSGWTLVAAVADDGEATWTWDASYASGQGLWGEADLGVPTGQVSATDGDYQSGHAMTLALANELAFVHTAGDTFHWLRYGVRDLGDEVSVSDLFTLSPEPPAACGEAIERHALLDSYSSDEEGW
ncbi:MAG: hypothetical protein QF464_07045, partial [Myxococcota bacterium]|nr:hypothetical protein [Myxococcota bacterium]